MRCVHSSTARQPISQRSPGDLGHRSIRTSSSSSKRGSLSKQMFGSCASGYEQLYRPIARSVYTKHNSKDSENIAYHQAYGKAVGRLMARLHDRGTSLPESVVRGPQRDTHAGFSNAWVGEESLEELNSLVERIWEICRTSRPDENTRLVNVGIMIAPDSRK